MHLYPHRRQGTLNISCCYCISNFRRYNNNINNNNGNDNNIKYEMKTKRNVICIKY